MELHRENGVALLVYNDALHPIYCVKNWTNYLTHASPASAYGKSMLDVSCASPITTISLQI